MPRRKTIRTSEVPYHVTARTNNKDFFQLPLSKVFDFFETWLNISALIHEAKTHHFKLMSNHIHWILSTPLENIDQIVSHVLTNVSKDINLELGRQNHVFGPRYKWSLLTNVDTYPYVVKYTYRNAVEAGICDKVEDYPYSTLGYYMGIHPCRIWVYPDKFTQNMEITSNVEMREMFLKWLNRDPGKLDTEAIRMALAEKIFTFQKTKKGAQLYEPQDLNFSHIKQF